MKQLLLVNGGKKVRNIYTGELYIETPDNLWDAALNSWKNDQSLPCPMPKGHIMFNEKSTVYKPIN